MIHKIERFKKWFNHFFKGHVWITHNTSNGNPFNRVCIECGRGEKKSGHNGSWEVKSYRKEKGML